MQRGGEQRQVNTQSSSRWTPGRESRNSEIGEIVHPGQHYREKETVPPKPRGPQRPRKMAGVGFCIHSHENASHGRPIKKLNNQEVFAQECKAQR